MPTPRLLKRRQRSAPIVLFISALMLVSALGLFVFDLVQFSQREDLLPAGTRVAGVPVGNLSLAQARSRWEQAYAEPLALYYRDALILLNPDTVGFQMSSDSMLADAAAAGEQQGGFWARFAAYMLGREDRSLRDIPLDATYQRIGIEGFLEDVARRYDSTGSSSSYNLDTLTLTTTAQGYRLDIPAAMSAIEDALQQPENRVVSLPVIDTQADRPGLNVLRDMIIEYLDTRGFIYDGQTTTASVYIQDLTTGEELNILGDVAYTAASTSKVGILIDYFRILEREPTDDDAFLMANSLLCSANSTSNLIMREMIGGGDQFVGIASVTNTLQYVGAINSFLTAPFVDGSPDQVFGSIQAPQTSPNPNFQTEPDPFNQTTAEDLGTLFAMLYDCAEYNTGLAAAYPNGEITQRECQQMLELMSANDLERLLQGGIPEGVRISHKNGWFNETVGNAGVVFPPNGRDYVISVFLWEDQEDNFQDHLVLWPLVEDISRAAWNYFVPQQPLTVPRQNLPPTAQECYTTDASGQRVYNYLPPYGQVNLNDIDAWRGGN